MGRNRPSDLASLADHRLKQPPSPPMFPRKMARAPGHTPRPLEQDSTRQGRPTQDRRHTETSLPNLRVDKTDSPSPTPQLRWIPLPGAHLFPSPSSPAGTRTPQRAVSENIVRIGQYLVIWYPKVYVRARSITHRSNTAIPTRPPVPDWFRNTGLYSRVFNPKQTTAD